MIGNPPYSPLVTSGRAHLGEHDADLRSQLFACTFQHTARKRIPLGSAAGHCLRQHGKIRSRPAVCLGNERCDAVDAPGSIDLAQQAAGNAAIQRTQTAPNAFQADPMSRAFIAQHRPPSAGRHPRSVIASPHHVRPGAGNHQDAWTFAERCFQRNLFVAGQKQLAGEHFASVASAQARTPSLEIPARPTQARVTRYSGIPWRCALASSSDMRKRAVASGAPTA